MSINRIHHKKKNFSVLHNEAPNNQKLKVSAIGILWFLLTKPDGWEVRTRQLVAQFPDGERIVKAALQNLEEQGYLIRWCERSDRGRLVWRSEIFETVEDAEAWKSENQDRLQNAIRLSKGTTSRFSEDSEDSPCVQNPYMVAPCDGQPCDGQPCDGERQVLINTDQSITDLVNTDQSITEEREDRAHDRKPTIDIEPRPISKSPASIPCPDLNPGLVQEVAGEDQISAAPCELAPVNATQRFERSLRSRAAQVGNAAFNSWWDGYRRFCLAVNASPGSIDESWQAWQSVTEGSEPPPDLLEGTELLIRDKGEQFLKEGKAIGVPGAPRFLRERRWIDAIERSTIKAQIPNLSKAQLEQIKAKQAADEVLERLKQKYPDRF